MLNLKQAVLDVVQLLRFDEATIHRVAHDRSALGMGLLFLGLGSFSLALGPVFFLVKLGVVTYRPDFSWVLSQAVGLFLTLSLLFILFGFFLENVLKSPLSARGFFQLFSMASLLGILGSFPVFFPFIWFWLLVLMAKVLISEAKLTSLWVFLFLLFFLLFGFWLI